MGVPSAPGYPVYSGNFIPQVWSTRLLTKFYPATVLAAICNTDYEGEIKNHGDTVWIRQTPDIQINSYQKGMTLTVQHPEAPTLEMLINKGQYFNFICDDIDKYQSDIKLLSDWSADAAQQMKIVIDKDVLGSTYSQASSYNQGATAGVISGSVNLGVSGAPLAVDKTNILDLIVDAGVVLDEQNAPEDNRWMVLPALFCGAIKKSDLKNASITGDGVSVMRNGRIGEIDRFTLYSSNLLTTVTDGTTSTLCYNAMFGHKSAISFAAQITNVENLRAESTFGTLVRGLNVYGYDVLKSISLGWIYATKGW